MPSVISSVSSTPTERDAWKRAAELAGSKLPVWCREALNAAADAAIAEAEAPPTRRLMHKPVPVESTQFDPGAPYVPPELPPLPIGAKTVAIDPDELDRYRQRGLVAGFIRAGGDPREWRGQGPNPLQRGCAVRADVLAEFAERLDALGGQVARKAEETAMMRASGVPA